MDYFLTSKPYLSHIIPQLFHLAALHAKVGIEVDKVGFMVTVRKDIVEEGIGRYTVPSVGGASSEETKLESIASGEHSEAVAMGMATGFRGIPHFPRHVIGVSFIFV